MGWDYEERIAYGVEVASWKNNLLKSLLDKYNAVLSYDKDMTSNSRGHIFVYVKSTYMTLMSDHGSYTGGRLDTQGDEFNPPRHGCFTEIDNSREPPTLTTEEQQALAEIKLLSKHECCWVHDARVFY